MAWEYPEIEALIQQVRRLREMTMSGNAGAYVVPLGGVLRAPNITGIRKRAGIRKRRKRKS